MSKTIWKKEKQAEIEEINTEIEQLEKEIAKKIDEDQDTEDLEFILTDLRLKREFLEFDTYEDDEADHLFDVEKDKESEK